MFTSVGEHGMVPLLVSKVFPPVGLSMQTLVFFRDTWHHPYITSCFCGNVFTFLVSLLFWSASCSVAHAALHLGSVLTTILYMPFDVMYYLFLCVLLLFCQPGLLSMEW